MFQVQLKKRAFYQVFYLLQLGGVYGNINLAAWGFQQNVAAVAVVGATTATAPVFGLANTTVKPLYLGFSKEKAHIAEHDLDFVFGVFWTLCPFKGYAKIVVVQFKDFVFHIGESLENKDAII